MVQYQDIQDIQDIPSSYWLLELFRFFSAGASLKFLEKKTWRSRIFDPTGHRPEDRRGGNTGLCVGVLLGQDRRSMAPMAAATRGHQWSPVGHRNLARCRYADYWGDGNPGVVTLLKKSSEFVSSWEDLVVPSSAASFSLEASWLPWFPTRVTRISDVYMYVTCMWCDVM